MSKFLGVSDMRIVNISGVELKNSGTGVLDFPLGCDMKKFRGNGDV